MKGDICNQIFLILTIHIKKRLFYLIYTILIQLIWFLFNLITNVI